MPLRTTVLLRGFRSRLSFIESSRSLLSQNLFCSVKVSKNFYFFVWFLALRFLVPKDCCYVIFWFMGSLKMDRYLGFLFLFVG